MGHKRRQSQGFTSGKECRKIPSLTERVDTIIDHVLLTRPTSTAVDQQGRHGQKTPVEHLPDDSRLGAVRADRTRIYHAGDHRSYRGTRHRKRRAEGFSGVIREARECLFEAIFANANDRLNTT